MGRKQSVGIVAVVEDRQLERFVRRTLEALGFDRNKVRILEDYPKGGGGSGKQYVEGAYQKEIVTFRQKSRENRALLLGSDADEQTVRERAHALDARISEVSQAPRGSDERIVYWILKWHVQTWGLHLTGTKVQEDVPYKNQAKSIAWREAGNEFVHEYQNSRSGNIETLDSLKTAYGETRRLGV